MEYVEGFVAELERLAFFYVKGGGGGIGEIEAEEGGRACRHFQYGLLVLMQAKGDLVLIEEGLDAKYMV